MFSIGELSRLTQLTVKTLRFYHEQGVLVPAYVDPDSGYRYYDQAQVEMARAISLLRSLEFPLSEIRELIHCDGGEDVLSALERLLSAIRERIRQLQKAEFALEQFISEEREARALMQAANEVCEKNLEPLLIAGIRMKGRYSDCGQAFGRIGRSLGRFISGKPLLLHYDSEYREDDADFEACMPIRKTSDVAGISMRELSGGMCVSLVHRGPYDQLVRSYSKVFAYLNDRKMRALMPPREVYLKGPGMIFKGNPKNYLTEIQFLVEPATLAERTG